MEIDKNQNHFFFFINTLVLSLKYLRIQLNIHHFARSLFCT